MHAWMAQQTDTAKILDILIVQPKINIFWTFNRLQGVQDVDGFVASSEQIWRNLAFRKWILCSEWVPSEWVQTGDKNITIIHESPVRQLTSTEILGSLLNPSLRRF